MYFSGILWVAKIISSCLFFGPETSELRVSHLKLLEVLAEERVSYEVFVLFHAELPEFVTYYSIELQNLSFSVTLLCKVVSEPLFV